MAADKERERRRKLEWQRKSHAENPEKRNASQRRRYQTNKATRERSLSKAKAWIKANRDRVNAYTREWNARNPDKVKARNWKQKLRRYGLTQEQYDALMDRQGGMCAICSCGFSDSVRRRINVDHCHRSGRVRGLLCNSCNLGLGLFAELATVLGRAAEYLQAGGGSWA